MSVNTYSLVRRVYVRHSLNIVVRFFLDTQNRLVTLHSTLLKVHEETDIGPRSVIYRFRRIDKAFFFKKNIYLSLGDLPRFYPSLRS